MNIFQKFFYGNITCRIKTQGSQRFFNICHAQNIPVYNVHSVEEYSYFSISLNNFKKLKSISHKSHIIPHIVKKYGLRIILHKYKHKLIFLISLILSIIVLCYISSFIWNIEYNGNVKYSDDTLTKALNELQIYSGKNKYKIDTDMIEEELRLKFDDIAWISVIIDGTVLKLYLKETLTINSQEPYDIPGDIFAETNCIIENIVTRNGTPKAVTGQYVQAGELLISGTVTLYNDDQTVKEEHTVHADGDIYGRYIYRYNAYYPKWYIDKSKINRKSYGVSINLFNQNLQLGKTAVSNTNCIQIVNNIHYRLTPNFYLPIQISIYKNHFYDPQKVTISDEYIYTQGKNQINQCLDELKNNGVTIHQHDLKIIIEEDYYAISGNIEITAPVGQFAPCQ